MGRRRWFCYSKCPAILLPVSIAQYWTGFYLPVKPSKKYPDLVIGDTHFKMKPELSVRRPKTDWDRAWSVLKNPPEVKTIDVGPGVGLLFAGDMDFVSWWAEDLMLLIGGGVLKKKMSRVEWSDQLVWKTKEQEFVLMCSTDHGADTKNKERFAVHLTPGEYTLQYGWYGWEAHDTCNHLFRFVLNEKPKGTRQRTLSQTK